MAFFFLDKTKLCGIFILLFTCFSSHVYSQITSLELAKESIVTVSGNSLSFRAVASNSVSYKAKLSCFNQEFNYKKGFLSVLKSEFHVGASASFSYDDCLDMRDSLLNETEKILLSWNQEKFDDFISAKLEFHRIEKGE